MKRRYPFYVLYITMPSEVVDVNVTPNKSDVRFVDNSIVYSAIYSTVSSVLDGTDQAVNIIVETKKPKKEEYKLVTITDNPVKDTKYPKDDFSKKGLGQILLNLEENASKFSDLPQIPKPETSELNEFIIDTDSEENDNNLSSSSLDIFAENKRYIEELERKKQEEQQNKEVEDEEGELKYVGQILKSFLIFERGSNIYFIDQHAAHERLLYNKLCYQRLTGEIDIQPLLVPYELNVNPIEFNVVNSKLSYLKGLGIDIKENDRGRFLVSAVPCELLSCDLGEFFKDILSDETFVNESIPERINNKLTQKACKSAVKVGMSLTDSEVKSLMILLNNDITLKCPHGRPIAVKITRKEIDKWFKRIV